MTDAPLKHRRALVTGAASGLGLAIAESLAKAGADLVLHDREEPRATAETLRARFAVEVASIGADLRNPAEIEAMMAGMLGRFGAIDILINNAVVRHFAPVEAFPSERWDDALAVNLSAPFHLARLALPAMKARDYGRIVNLASIYSTRAAANRIDYMTTKAAILGLTRAIAVETARTGITCNAISPGVLPTPAIRSRIAGIAAESGRARAEVETEYLAARQPSSRFVALDAVGAMVVFLCGPAGRDITGATLPIDGGWSAH
jgi:3-hydroxybutyrate dehydrogenase